MLAPVLAGCCRYESIVDGTLTIFDLARLNDALATRAENEARARSR